MQGAGQEEGGQTHGFWLLPTQRNAGRPAPTLHVSRLELTTLREAKALAPEIALPEEPRMLRGDALTGEYPYAARRRFARS